MNNNYKSFLIKYNEIGLKGKNRYIFEDALVDNIKKSLNDSSTFNIYKEQERIYVDTKSEFDYEDTLNKLKNIFGIYSISPVLKLDFIIDFDKLKNIILDYIENIYGIDNNHTFKFITRRVNKKFPLHSNDINMELGHIVLEKFKNMSVDVHNPDIYFIIEIRNHINVYSEVIMGPGGMPIGTSGKAMLLLSGGINSPVAGYMISKRGVRLEAVSFNAPPFTSDRAKQKVIDLANIVSKYSSTIKLHIINFTDIQTYIYETCPHDELTIIMRRIMMNIAERIAKNDNCQALITGKSIGQVASQTMESLYCTNAICNLPVFRPLISFDKEEIITIAKKINTYDTSILPYEDCCTIFVAKHPVTKPKLDKIIKSESKLIDIEEKILKAINEKEIIFC